MHTQWLKKKNPKLNLEISFWGVSSLGYTTEEKQSCYCAKKAVSMYVMVVWLKVQNLTTIVFQDAEIQNLKQNGGVG